MSDVSEEADKQGGDNLDLSSLSSLSLGPDWGSGNAPKQRLPKDHGDDAGRRGDRPRGDRRDRRGAVKRQRPPREREPRERREAPREREPFMPIVEVDFYPEEEPFKKLAQAVKTSYRTFELFELARLILEKPERFVCVLKDPEQKEGGPALLTASVPDGLPFRSEEAALNHVFKHFINEFFELETVEGEAPAGNFQMVHKCGMTGELLGPPNYHRYQALCREHHARKLAHVPFNRFEEKIVSTREEEDIKGWLEQMKVQTHYKSKEDESVVLKTAEEARIHLLTHAKEQLIRPAYSARFSGKSLTLLEANDPIRRSVEALLDQQKRFPLATANHLRGRLRRMKFSVYKKGSKGISYVCAVKRRFRQPGETMADNLQELLDFLEAHSNFPAMDLPSGFLGIRAKGEANEAEAPVEYSDAEKAAISQLRTDLRYLVSEGYVTEYSDGRLSVPPVREEEKSKAAESPKAEPEAPKVAKAPVEAAAAPPAEVAPAAETTPEPEASGVSEPTETVESSVDPDAPAEVKTVVEAVVETESEEPAEVPDPVELPATEEVVAAPVEKAEEPVPAEAGSTEPVPEEAAPEAPSAVETPAPAEAEVTEEPVVEEGAPKEEAVESTPEAVDVPAATELPPPPVEADIPAEEDSKRP
jgi:hypothetical protein